RRWLEPELQAQRFDGARQRCPEFLDRRAGPRLVLRSFGRLDQWQVGQRPECRRTGLLDLGTLVWRRVRRATRFCEPLPKTSAERVGGIQIWATPLFPRYNFSTWPTACVMSCRGVH